MNCNQHEDSEMFGVTKLMFSSGCHWQNKIAIVLQNVCSSQHVWVNTYILRCEITFGNV